MSAFRAIIAAEDKRVNASMVFGIRRFYAGPRCSQLGPLGSALTYLFKLSRYRAAHIAHHFSGCLARQRGPLARV